MIEPESYFKEISNALLLWYKHNRRDLPWRQTSDPYLIWISEVILQQTRVEQGISYYHRFAERFPDVQSLAAADEQEVMKLWQGLGYYSRAQNLHKASRQITEELHGNFPKTYSDLIQLKGVGDYTASAIASIAYGLPHAVVDGNVYRVLSRLFEIDEPIDSSAGKKTFAKVAAQLLNKEYPSDHNQAIMELGALICTPKLALCNECPLQAFCSSYKSNRVYDYPVKKGRIIKRNRFLNYFHITHNDFIYIQKRKKADIWKNLYELPLIETSKATNIEQLMNEKNFKTLFQSSENVAVTPVYNTRHLLTHQVLHISFYKVEYESTGQINNNTTILKTDINYLSAFPVPVPIENYFSRFVLKEL